MPALSVAAAVALAFGTHGNPPCVPMVHGRAAVPVDLLLSVAMEETGLDPSKIGHNPNGTDDYGLLQINSENLARLGLTPQSALDPCASMRAASRVLLEAYDGGVTDRERLRSILHALSRYNTGSPTRGTAYAERVLATAQTKIIPALAEILPHASANAVPSEQKPAEMPIASAPSPFAGAAKPARELVFNQEQ
jgi:hypothetical protein